MATSVPGSGSPDHSASTMRTFVALLHGINVGKAKRVPMAELRDLLTELGYADVATLLNSGNVVFRSATGTPVEHAAEIAHAIAANLKVEVPVIVKPARVLADIVSENPLAEKADDYSRLLVAFVQDKKALSRLAAIGPLVVPPEPFAVGKHAAYLNCVNGIHASKAGAALLGKAGKLATTRNWATVLKLEALAKPQASNTTKRCHHRASRPRFQVVMTVHTAGGMPWTAWRSTCRARYVREGSQLICAPANVGARLSQS